MIASSYDKKKKNYPVKSFQSKIHKLKYYFEPFYNIHQILFKEVLILIFFVVVVIKV